MCGRFSLTATPADVRAVFHLDEEPLLQPRYNIAPSQDVAVVRRSEAGGRELVLMRWGLIPSFARDPAVGYRTINARAESVADKPAFREAFRTRRCLVLADGFYEWQAGGPYGKTPHYIRRPDRSPFAFAGLWERWRAPDGHVLETCSIVTTSANERVRELHDRMPVVLAPEHHDVWLDPGTDRERLIALLTPAPPSAFELYAVSTVVNRPENEGPECIEPVPMLFGGLGRP
jgi:putative SOS response-associated peptidase YedK